MWASRAVGNWCNNCGEVETYVDEAIAVSLSSALLLLLSDADCDYDNCDIRFEREDLMLLHTAVASIAADGH